MKTKRIIKKLDVLLIPFFVLFLLSGCYSDDKLFETEDAPEVSDEEFDFRSYGDSGFQWNVSLTFGYCFTTK